MEVFRIVGIALGCIQALLALLDTNKKLARDLATGLAFLKEDLDMIKRHLEQNKELHLQPEMELKLQELAYDIEDFVQGLCIPGPWGGFFRSAMRLDIRQEHIDRMVYFKSRAENLGKKLEKSSESMKTGSGTTSGTAGVCDAPMIKEKDLVGIAKPKEEISDLLFRSDGPLRVISIVGCSGLGKTALASAIYHDPKIECEFDFTAWVVASKDSPAGILEKILEAAGLASPNGSTSKASQHIPWNKRYLFFLDDVQQKGIIWIDIKETFSKNDMGSRIILTTRAPSVAAACSPGGYIYNMKCLGKDESKVLLWTKAINCGKEPAAFATDSEHIYLKCGGLPLALISAGLCLSVKGLDLDRDYCNVVGETLGDYLVDDNEVAFPEMRRALVQCYDKLPNQDHRNCLLYASIFPRGYQINSNSLVRKLIAEELVDNDGRKCWEELIDRSMIEEVRDDSKVATKRCKVHSIMLEFAIKKAVARNFVSLIHEGKLQHNPHICTVRRLTLQPGHDVSRGGVKEEVDLSSFRSLTIFDSEILDFKSCRVIRILDLEGCSWLNKKVVDEICELVFIKYLNLRKTGITTLPKEVRKLKCLETLDIRDRSENIAPSSYHSAKVSILVRQV